MPQDKRKWRPIQVDREKAKRLQALIRQRLTVELSGAAAVAWAVDRAIAQLAEEARDAAAR